MHFSIPPPIKYCHIVLRHNLSFSISIVQFVEAILSSFDTQEDLLNKFEINKATNFIWGKITELDELIQKEEPFKVVKVDLEKGKLMISELAVKLYTIARMLTPIMPETAEEIKKLIKENKKPEKPLFLRKD